MSGTALFLATITIILWSFLAYLGASLNHLPSLLVVAIALCISGLFSSFRFRSWKIPATTFLVGIGGLFGYHFLYFSAYKYAPAVETNLINYLWPLLIVLLSPLFLKDHRLHIYHLAGAFLGLCGAALIISEGKILLDTTFIKGYALAAGAALVWACYSLMTKKLPSFPTGAVGAFCLTSGLLAFGVFWLSASQYGAIRVTTADWIALILLGIGPMGVAFFTWDAALKRGDPRIIGSLAYLTPMTSTLVLVLLGGYRMTWVSAIAMILIVSGAALGSLDLFREMLASR